MCKRKKDRPPIIYNLKVDDRNTGDTLGYVVDITTEGLRLISENPVAVSARVPLRIHLPHNTMSQPPIDLFAELKWCKRQAEGKHAIGAYFLELSESSLATVHELIRRFHALPDESTDDPYLQNVDQSEIQ